MKPILFTALVKHIRVNRVDVSDSAALITSVCIDTRQLIHGENALFVALPGRWSDGHQHLSEAVNKGVRNFVVSREAKVLEEGRYNVMYTSDVLEALQCLAGYYRALFTDLEVIGITGSNGKTTIKEWLAQMVSSSRSVVKSPKSYNSQIGVALSMFEIESTHELAIFEAGISRVGEMAKLKEMIRPKIGVFSNIGDAHSAGFASLEEKIAEKAILFEAVEKLVYCSDQKEVHAHFSERFSSEILYAWGSSSKARLFRVVSTERGNSGVVITLQIQEERFRLETRLMDAGSIENILHCLAVLLVLKIDISEALRLCQSATTLPMRLEMAAGNYGNLLINDAYNHDFKSLQIAFDVLEKQAGEKRKVAILTDFDDQHQEAKSNIADIASWTKKVGLSELWWIGDSYPHADRYFSNTNEVLEALKKDIIKDSVLLIKGARKHRLERIKEALSSSKHSTSLKIDLTALEHNLRIYSSHLRQHTGMIAVLKASGYGSGSVEVARVLQNLGIKYLAVAFSDEGIALRKHGITMPIIVLNPDNGSVSDMTEFMLQPEVYSVDQLKHLVHSIEDGKSSLSVHLKIDSGMNRLGIQAHDVADVISILKNSPLRVETMFSHLAGSESSAEDVLTHAQAEKFTGIANRISEGLGYQPLRHLVNTAGILRFEQYHFDLVRIGLGMYGIDQTGVLSEQLERVHTLSATLIQIKTVGPNDLIGYNGKGSVHKETRIGIVNIGYADGLHRLAGNGRFSLFFNGQLAPILGNVCMDLTIVDLSECPEAVVGDQFEVFGKNHRIEVLASACETIPYEILSGISPRVKREYVLG